MSADIIRPKCFAGVPVRNPKTRGRPRGAISLRARRVSADRDDVAYRLGRACAQAGYLVGKTRSAKKRSRLLVTISFFCQFMENF